MYIDTEVYVESKLLLLKSTRKQSRFSCQTNRQKPLAKGEFEVTHSKMRL